jgi:hypothetical protein
MDSPSEAEANPLAHAHAHAHERDKRRHELGRLGEAAFARRFAADERVRLTVNQAEAAGDSVAVRAASNM